MERNPSSQQLTPVLDRGAGKVSLLGRHDVITGVLKVAVKIEFATPCTCTHGRTLVSMSLAGN